MPIIKNVSPLGELDVPLLGRFLDYEEEIEVSDDVAERLLPQAENYQPVDDAAKAVLAKLYPADEPEEGEGDSEDAEPVPDTDPKPQTKTRARRQSGDKQ